MGLHSQKTHVLWVEHVRFCDMLHDCSMSSLNVNFKPLGHWFTFWVLVTTNPICAPVQSSGDVYGGVGEGRARAWQHPSVYLSVLCWVLPLSHSPERPGRHLLHQGIADSVLRTWPALLTDNMTSENIIKRILLFNRVCRSVPPHQRGNAAWGSVSFSFFMPVSSGQLNHYQ